MPPTTASLVPSNASGGALSVTSDRKCPKNAAKTHGFGILARARCGMCRDLSTPRIKMYNPAPCFRTVPASIHRDALRACAACPNRENPQFYRAARCGHRALRNSIGKRCVGRGALTPPPVAHRTPCPPIFPLSTFLFPLSSAPPSSKNL